MLVGIQRRDAEARHLDTKLLPLSTEELDMSMLYILRNFGLARSLVLGMHSGIPSRSSKVDWRENSVVASVKTLRDDGSGRCSDERCSNISRRRRTQPDSPITRRKTIDLMTSWTGKMAQRGHTGLSRSPDNENI